MKIGLSPDENPGDPGAVDNGIVERDINIAVATHLQSALARCGQEVWFDPSLTYEQRVAKANSDGTQLLIACAHNASGSPDAEGAVLVICPGGDEVQRQGELAKAIGDQLVAGGLVGRWNIYHENVYEGCEFNGPTGYVEFAYETNPTDAATIKQPDYAPRAAELLCQGIASWAGFAYAPPVHPSAPIPEWKLNLEQLPAPMTGTLADGARLFDLVQNMPLDVALSPRATVVAKTTVRGSEYYLTQFSVDHVTGYGIPVAAFTELPSPVTTTPTADPHGPPAVVVPPLHDGIPDHEAGLPTPPVNPSPVDVKQPATPTTQPHPSELADILNAGLAEVEKIATEDLVKIAIALAEQLPGVLGVLVARLP